MGRTAFVCLGVGGLAAALWLGLGREPVAGSVAGSGPVAEPARLVAEPQTWDLGRIQAADALDLECVWRREGHGDLRVLGTRTGCGCISIRDLPLLLPQGASGRLCLSLRIPGDPGPLDVPVRIVSDALPPDDVLTLRVRAFVGERSVVRPGWLDLGRRSPGARVPATFAVHLPPGAPEPLTWELVAWSGEVTRLPAAHAGRHGPDLRLESVLPSRPGPCVGALRIATAAGDLLVPLRAVVVPPPRN